MKEFTLTSPDGKSYTVQGPDDATPEQAYGVLQQQLRATTAPSALAAPPATAPPRVGALEENLVGPTEILGASALNLPANAINSLNDLGTRISGGAYRPGRIPTVPVGAAGRQLAGDIAQLPGIRDTLGAAQNADRALESTSPTAHDVLHQAGGVLGDVANITPMAAPVGATGEAISNAVMDAAKAAAAAKAPLAAGDIEAALKAVGYPSLPSKTPNAPTLSRVGASAVGESTLTGPQSITSQAVTDRLAQHEAGLTPSQELNYANVEAARKEGPAKVYDAAHAALPPTMAQDPQLQSALKGIGDTTSQLPSTPDVDALKQHMLSQPTMTTDQLFANVQTARDKAAKLFNATTPDAPALADAYLSVANAYEDFIGRQLAANPNSPVSLQDFQNARTAFAKNYAVQNSLRGTSVDATKFATLQRKEPGLLTGPSMLIAEQANRYPLSSRFGPTTVADTGVGPSGSVPGQMARHIAGPLLGGSVGYLAGGVPGALGAGALGELAATKLMNVVRNALSGSPEAARAKAGAALTDPRLADILAPREAPEPPPGPLNLEPPPGRAFEPHQPELATGSPDPRELPLDLRGYRLRPPEGTAFEPNQPGLAAGAGFPAPPSTPRELAERAQRPGPQLSLIDQLMGAAPENNSDLAAVMHQGRAQPPSIEEAINSVLGMGPGVPEGIIQRTAPPFKPSLRDRAGTGLDAKRIESELYRLLDPNGG